MQDLRSSNIGFFVFCLVRRVFGGRSSFWPFVFFMLAGRGAILVADYDVRGSCFARGEVGFSCVLE